MTEQQSLTPLKTLLFAFHATQTIIISYLPVYLQGKGLNGSEIGWVLAVGPFAAIISQPFWGYLSDKYKTVKKILLLCIIGLIIFSSIFFSMKHFIWIMMIGFFFYFFATPIGALGDSLAQRRADEVGVSFGTIRTWGSIGFATSSLAIGLVLTFTGVEYMVWPYLTFAFIALFVTLRVQDVDVAKDPISFADVKKLLLNKPFILFLFFMMFLTISHRANDSFIGLYVTQLGGTNFIIGTAWFIGVISEAIVFATAGRWFRKYHTLIFVILAGAIYSVRWILYGLADSYWVVLALQFMHGLTFGVLYLASLDYVTRLIPKLTQSTGHLLFYAVFFGISGIIGSLIGGALIDVYGGSTLYFVLGTIAFAGTIFMTIYHILPFGKKA
ncbi:MFS transporter [Piscibacillus halophilus]|uniref:MFS transporter, PPP family, 3-phenylpropionic acid transporter n=1 Tax=Piscibacillus halophilus TaxID=571933 RepID=A0A1H9M9N2_9BACI|nr:MFS transporter [Piscibacillus halophilus]SER20460.1 MFS transporter, PPP family, 3-phenylpropionic acid transporter [Piscibacillus halophilus]